MDTYGDGHTLYARGGRSTTAHRCGIHSGGIDRRPRAGRNQSLHESSQLALELVRALPKPSSHPLGGCQQEALAVAEEVQEAVGEEAVEG